ncbi:MAG: hydrogenase/urease maturation nickel metallochaperone HypA [Desulfobacterota bacterium]|nr:hydrogenase/urease maturation nickel metallochaperone HypA [Thermodesulfobacteriota bacterium]
MHEFSVASDIVDQVLEAARKRGGKRVLSVRLDIGELTLLNAEQLLFWVKELFKGSIAENAEIAVKIIKARISCAECGYRGGTREDQCDAIGHQILPLCPRCGSLQVEIERGRECLLRGIRAER